MSNLIQPVSDRLQCRHIMTGGHRCGSPSLRNEDFCYYHHTTRKPAPLGGAIVLRKPTHFDLPMPEDRSAVQHSIGEVLRLIAADQLDHRRAGLLLYGLQIASHNLSKEPTPPPIETIDEFTDDPDQGPLAPTAHFKQAARERTLEEILVEQWEREKPASAFAQDDEVYPQLPSFEDLSKTKGEGA